MESFMLNVTYTAKPGCRENFVREAIDSGIVDTIRQEDGYIRYDYFYSAHDDNTILLIEEWETETHQQIHLKQPHMAKLKEIKEKYVDGTQLKHVQLK